MSRIDRIRAIAKRSKRQAMSITSAREAFILKCASLYVEKKLSTYEISKRLRRSQGAVARALDAGEITRRTSRQARLLKVVS